jgi:hypothetical protein
MMLPDKDAGSSFNVLSKTSARGQLKIFVRISAGVVARGNLNVTSFTKAIYADGGAVGFGIAAR